MYDKGYLLFDASPFLYIGYNASLYMLKSETHPFFLEKTKQIIQSKVMQCLDYAEMQCNEILPVFCYDGFPQWKQELQKGTYKENRSPLSSKYKSILKAEMKKYPGLHFYNKDEEADDLICTVKQKLIKKFGITKESNVQFYIFTRDNDLLQLCDSKTVLYDPAKDVGLKDERYLEQKFGITNFKKLVLYKICFGDPSDNIVGIFKGKRRKPILEMINSVKNYSEFYANELVLPQIDEAKRLEKVIHLKKDCELSTKIFNDFNSSDIFGERKWMNF